jgi:hypothetical protein
MIGRYGEGQRKLTSTFTNKWCSTWLTSASSTQEAKRPYSTTFIRISRKRCLLFTLMTYGSLKSLRFMRSASTFHINPIQINLTEVKVIRLLQKVVSLKKRFAFGNLFIITKIKKRTYKFFPKISLLQVINYWVKSLNNKSPQRNQKKAARKTHRFQ